MALGELRPRGRGMKMIFISILAMISAVGSVLAAEYGPYRYRTGVEQTHIRWEAALDLNQTRLNMKVCGEFIMNFESKNRSCSTESDVAIKKRGNTVSWASGYETYRLNLKTKRLRISDGRPIADVEPGSTPWESASIVD